MLNIVIVEYNPAWSTLYEQEKALILEAIGPWLVDIQHIGSTSVPGLAAKPIIDIMPGIRYLYEASNCIAPLEKIGYKYVPEFEDVMPYRRYFRKDIDGQRTHHIHMVETSHEFWERHLLFRDYLRKHPAIAQQYAELKKDLAARYLKEGFDYTEAKTEFIKTIEKRAKQESEARIKESE